MTQKLRRSFSIQLPEPVDPAASQWLDRFDKLIAELDPLEREGHVTYKDTLYQFAPEEVVDDNEIHRIILHAGEVSKGTMRRAVGSVMQALAVQSWRLDVDVRFYCRDYGHLRGACYCDKVISDTHFSAFGPVYKGMNVAYPYWVLAAVICWRLATATLPA